MLVEGEPGSGRSLVAGQACARLRLSLRHVRRESLDPSGAAAPFSGRALRDSVLWLPAVAQMTPTKPREMKLIIIVLSAFFERTSPP